MKEILNKKQKIINYKADLFGKLFELSIKKGYDSEQFISQLMTDDAYKELLNFDDGQDWCDENFLLAKLKRKKDFIMSKKQYAQFDMWFMGYLYKYWMSTYNKKPNEVFKLLPVDKFYNNLGFYHTQGWEKIIKDCSKLKGVQNEK